MLNVVYSNDMRQLAAHLAETQQTQPLPPMQAETIIVQSNELARWLSLWMAQQQGVTANTDFPFPSAYIWRLFRELWPETPLQSPYAKEPLSWRLYDVLPEIAQQPGFDAVASYLADNSDALKRLQLAERLADTYDQYLMYRPDWIADWEAGQAKHWQGSLWQHLTADDEQPMHRARLLQQLHQLLSQVSSRPQGLPQRLSIFGISAMPPVYLQTFALMARFVDITLYFLSPSEHYWGDVIDQKQQQRQQLQLDFDEPDDMVGHSLLASLGKQGQEFFRQLQDIEHESEARFVEPDTGTMLADLKYDIFMLTQGERRGVSIADDSVAIHVCHSPMREIEVLHDQLLALFERKPDLAPTDIVVMTPDIDIYAPWIEAVFATTEESKRIPFSIADSSGQQESQLINTFYTLLQLPQSRFDVETVLSLLECQPIQQQFGLDEGALNWVRQWCQETRTRWGVDKNDKTALDLPANDANTWRAGLDRLLLGYAMPLSEPGQSWRLFDNQLAMDGISGERARIVAALCEFIDTLDDWRNRLAKPCSIIQWQSELNHCLDAFFSTQGLENEQFENEITAIRKQLERLVESAEYASFEQDVNIELMLDWLQSHLTPVDNSHRFLGHGVTFCGMVPMRSIPFSMVCLIGMNDDVFPRRQPALSFDLLSNDHREGDRSRRDDDRYLFLEAILSADEMLYISYVGASILDNSEIPPSVLVSDLQDCLSERFSAESGGDILSQIVTHHPLQPFSRRYFDNADRKLFSFNANQCPVQDKVELPPWFDSALPEADDSWRELTRDQLIRFFSHPARFLVRERLSVRLELENDELESREPFALDGLESWQLRQWLLEATLSQAEDRSLKSLVQATGMLPQGHFGDAWFDQEAKVVESFVEKLTPNLPEERFFDVPVELMLEGFSIGGQLQQVSKQGLLRYRLARKKGKDILAAWIDHLLLNIIRPEGVKLETRLIMQDAELLFMPVTGPSQLLADLLQLYWQGCHQPLALFDQASLAFAQASLDDKPVEEAFKKARVKWQSASLDYPGEESDPYYQLLYSQSPLDETFAEIALRVYQPVKQYLQGGEL